MPSNYSLTWYKSLTACFPSHSLPVLCSGGSIRENTRTKLFPHDPKAKSTTVSAKDLTLKQWCATGRGAEALSQCHGAREGPGQRPGARLQPGTAPLRSTLHKPNLTATAASETRVSASISFSVPGLHCRHQPLHSAWPQRRAPALSPAPPQAPPPRAPDRKPCCRSLSVNPAGHTTCFDIRFNSPSSFSSVSSLPA